MYEKTKPELFERLISKTRMTGRPSIFLSELREVAEKVGVGDDLIRHKFIQSIPAGIATALASQRELTLSQLGKLADELMPLVQYTPSSVNAVPSQAPPPEVEPRCSMAQQQYRQQRFAARCRTPTRSFARETPTSDANMGLVPYHADQRPKVCRAHLFFGSKARTCKPWCQWPSKADDVRMQPSSRAASPTRSVTNSEN